MPQKSSARGKLTRSTRRMTPSLAVAGGEGTAKGMRILLKAKWGENLHACEHKTALTIRSRKCTIPSNTASLSLVTLSRLLAPPAPATGPLGVRVAHARMEDVVGVVGVAGRDGPEVGRRAATVAAGAGEGGDARSGIDYVPPRAEGSTVVGVVVASVGRRPAVVRPPLPPPPPPPPPPRGSRRRRRRRPVVAKFLPTLSQSLRYRQPTLDELAPASMLEGARGQQRHRAQRRSSSPRSNGGGRRAVVGLKVSDAGVVAAAVEAGGGRGGAGRIGSTASSTSWRRARARSPPPPPPPSMMIPPSSRRMCLWNGFIASAPAHPYLVRNHRARGEQHTQSLHSCRL